MRARDLMQPEVFTTNPSESLTDAARRMRDHEVGSLLVMGQHKEILAVISERDLLQVMADGIAPRLTPVAVCMTRDPVTVTPETGLQRMAELMARYGIRHLPVVEQGVPVGMVSARDLIWVDAAAERRTGGVGA